MIAGAPSHVFADTWNLQGYSPQFRKTLTEFARSAGDRILSVHVLQRSRIIAMGTALSRAVLGANFHAYAGREQFDAALSNAVGRGP